MWRFLNNIFVLVFLPATVFGQAKDSTLHKSFIPTGIRVSTDLISLIRTPIDESFAGYEVNADIDFYRYFLAVDAGRWERNVSSENEKYANSGNYMRMGVDVNFLKKDPEKNMLFFGVRYGWGTYSENLLVLKDPLWGAVEKTYINSDVKAGWGELTTGLRVKMWKFFWLGYTARYKFGLNTAESGEVESYDVPGYGKTAKQSTWGFNYQILFRIPIRKNGQPKRKVLNKKDNQ